MELRFLSQEDVVACGGADMSLVLPIIERVLALHADDDAIVPSKTVLRWGDLASELSRGRINAMPGYVGGDFDAAGIKWISSFPANVQRGLPRGVGVLLLNDPATGVPRALLEGTLISAMRTGAIAGVAARHLVAPDAAGVGLIGAGVINRATLRAVKEALPQLAEATIHDRDAARAEAFAADLARELSIEVRVAPSAEQAVRELPLVVTATTSPEPIVRAEWLAPEATYCQLGGNECEEAVVLEAARNLVDDWVEVRHRGTQTIARLDAAGKLPPGAAPVELGEVVLGRAPRRREGEGRIVVSAIGMGIEDIAIGVRLLAEAERRGVGRTLQLWQQPFAV